MRLVRGLFGLLLTGLVVEIALMPFALYHFHKAGLYGVAANMVAIPLTTFVIMPLEAGALMLDAVGLGAPLWAATGWTIDAMLGLAHRVGSAEGAVAMLPTMPRWAFALMVGGGLWLCLWTSRIRLMGLVPFAVGALGAALAPVPDLLVTGDGQHLALVRDDGVPVLLRSRSGDFVRDLMSEASAYDGDPLALEEQRFARCSRDACIADIVEGGARLAPARHPQPQPDRLDRAYPRLRRRRHRRRRPLAAEGLHAALAEARPQGAGADRRGGDLSRRTNPKSKPSPTGSAASWAASTPLALALAPDRQFASRRIDEVEAPAAGEGEDRLGDHSARLRPPRRTPPRDRRPGSPAAARPGLVGLAVEADVDVAAGRRGIVGAVIGELPAERLGIEAARQLMRGDARQFDIIDPGHG